MKRSTMIAEDIFRHYGAVLSITQLAEYMHGSRDTARKILATVPPIGSETGKRYFYQEAAEALINYQGGEKL